jgi:hypothetical protein
MFFTVSGGLANSNTFSYIDLTNGGLTVPASFTDSTFTGNTLVSNSPSIGINLIASRRNTISGNSIGNSGAGNGIIICNLLFGRNIVIGNVVSSITNFTGLEI